MDLPTYTNIWRIEKRLYKLYDLRLPMPLPLVQIGVFIGVFVPWIVLLRVVGIPFHAPWHVLYIVPPLVLTWLATRPVIEGKRLTELLLSQTRYLVEPRTWCRLTPIREPREVTVTVKVWRRSVAVRSEVSPETRKAAGRAERRRARKLGRVPAVPAVEASASLQGRAAARMAASALALRPAPGVVPEPLGERLEARDARVVEPFDVEAVEASAVSPVSPVSPAEPVEVFGASEVDESGAEAAEAEPAAWRSMAKWPPPAPKGSSTSGESAPAEAGGVEPRESDAVEPREIEPPPATPKLEGGPVRVQAVEGSGKRGIASGVRRPGAAAEFWKAIAPTDKAIAPTETEGTPAPVTAETPAEPPNPAEPPQAPPPDTVPDIPVVVSPAKPTRPDIPMVPGAFGSGGRTPKEPEDSGAQQPRVEDVPAKEIPLPPPVDLAQRSKPLTEVRDVLVWPPAGQKRRYLRLPDAKATTVDPVLVTRPDPGAGVVDAPQEDTPPEEKPRSEKPPSVRALTSPKPWPPQPLSGPRSGSAVPPKPQWTPYKSPPPAPVADEPAAASAAASSGSESSGSEAGRPAVPPQERGRHATQEFSIPEVPGAPVRSGPTSPVRPRPRPLTPPEPPPTPQSTITPPDVEQEGTAGGLRRLIQAVGGGSGQADAEYEERLQRPFQGTRRIVVLGCTGGAGQTVTGLMLGHTFAQYCGEPVVAIDVNPGTGSLARRTRSETPETLAGLIARADQVHSLTAMRRYTSSAKSGLDVIAAGKNPLQSLDDRDYALAIRTLDRFYSVTLLDAAAAIVARVLPHADQIVLVAPASGDAPRAVGMTFEWLDGHGYDELRSRAVTVINGVSRRSLEDVEQAEAVARGRCRALVRIPWDDHLSLDRAPRNELKSLRAPTRRAYLALAGVVAGGFVNLPERYQQEQEKTWEQEVGRP